MRQALEDDPDLTGLELFERLQRKLPIIELKRDTTKEAVCLVFEKVNTGDVPLPVSELVTASEPSDSLPVQHNFLIIFDIMYENSSSAMAAATCFAFRNALRCNALQMEKWYGISG